MTTYNHHYNMQDQLYAQEHILSDGYSNGEEELDDVACHKCGAKPEDVLILTCDHNLCLPCAARNLAQQQNQNTFQVS